MLTCYSLDHQVVVWRKRSNQICLFAKC